MHKTYNMCIYIFISWLSSYICFIFRCFHFSWVQINNHRESETLQQSTYINPTNIILHKICPWILELPLIQVALTCTQIWWTSDVGMAFARLEEGYDNAMKEFYRKQVSQLNTLISMLIGQLTPGDRQKVMTICTIDVHARDVVAKIIAQKVRWGQWTKLARNLYCINFYANTVIAAVFYKRLLPVSNALKIFKQGMSLP